VSLYSTVDDQPSNGLHIEVDDLERAIKAGKTYYPQAVGVPAEYRKQGTAIVLDKLKSKRADVTTAALRIRLARRFDVVSQTPESQGGFYIDINDEPITYKDRQELKKLEFIWEFGANQLPDDALPTEVTRFEVDPGFVNEEKNWKITGWIGTAKHPTDLTEDVEIRFVEKHHRVG
jgi:hypothetical protein